MKSKSLQQDLLLTTLCKLDCKIIIQLVHRLHRLLILFYLWNEEKSKREENYKTFRSLSVNSCRFSLNSFLIKIGHVLCFLPFNEYEFFFSIILLTIFQIRPYCYHNVLCYLNFTIVRLVTRLQQ